MKTILNLALFTLLAVAGAPGVARADQPGYKLGAGGMSAHVTEGLAKPESGTHAKDHHVVRVQMLGSVNDRPRTFVAYTEKRTPATSTKAATVHYQFINGHVDNASGKVVATRVESGKK